MMRRIARGVLPRKRPGPLFRALHCALLCAGLGGGSAAQEAVARFGSGKVPLLVRSTTDISVIEPALEAFVQANPDLAIVYEQWGSNALYETSQKACAGEGQVADAVLSSASHQMVDLVNRACASRYRSERTAALPPPRRWRDELWGLTEEPAVIIYNTDLVAAEEVPRNRFALLDLMRQKPDAYRGRIATYDIEESGLGYLYAFSDSLEATTFGALLEGFARTEAVATCCSAEIINSVAEGRFLIAYNVLGSYVQNGAAANVGVILPEDYTLFMSRAYLIPRGAANRVGAERLLDFMLSEAGQRIIRDKGLVFEDDPALGGLLPSARRFIALDPPLLVALDQQKVERFVLRWRNAFSAPVSP